MYVTANTVGEAELLAEVRTAEGVATTVRGSFTVLPPAASSPACHCYPVGMRR
jgi:hypothetical protein